MINNDSASGGGGGGGGSSSSGGNGGIGGGDNKSKTPTSPTTSSVSTFFTDCKTTFLSTIYTPIRLQYEKVKRMLATDSFKVVFFVCMCFICFIIINSIYVTHYLQTHSSNSNGQNEAFTFLAHHSLSTSSDYGHDYPNHPNLFQNIIFIEIMISIPIILDILTEMLSSTQYNRKERRFARQYIVFIITLPNIFIYSGHIPTMVIPFTMYVQYLAVLAVIVNRMYIMSITQQISSTAALKEIMICLFFSSLFAMLYDLTTSTSGTSSDNSESRSGGDSTSLLSSHHRGNENLALIFLVLFTFFLIMTFVFICMKMRSWIKVSKRFFAQHNHNRQLRSSSPSKVKQQGRQSLSFGGGTAAASSANSSPNSGANAAGSGGAGAGAGNNKPGGGGGAASSSFYFSQHVYYFFFFMFFLMTIMMLIHVATAFTTEGNNGKIGETTDASIFSVTGNRRSGNKMFFSHHLEPYLCLEIYFIFITVVLCLHRNNDIRKAEYLAQNQLEYNRKMTRSISHEIRTPLNTAFMALDLMISTLNGPSNGSGNNSRTNNNNNKDKDKKDKNNKAITDGKSEGGLPEEERLNLLEIAGSVREGCDISLNILNQLLTFEKLSANMMKLELKLIPITQIIEHNVLLFKMQAQQRGIRFIVEGLPKGFGGLMMMNGEQAFVGLNGNGGLAGVAGGGGGINGGERNSVRKSIRHPNAVSSTAAAASAAAGNGTTNGNSATSGASNEGREGRGGGNGMSPLMNANNNSNNTDDAPPLNPFNELYVFVDEHKLNQVIRNLLSNAMKFTPKYGFVIVKLHWHNPTGVTLGDENLANGNGPNSGTSNGGGVGGLVRRYASSASLSSVRSRVGGGVGNGNGNANSSRIKPTAGSFKARSRSPLSSDIEQGLPLSSAASTTDSSSSTLCCSSSRSSSSCCSNPISGLFGDMMVQPSAMTSSYLQSSSFLASQLAANHHHQQQQQQHQQPHGVPEGMASKLRRNSIASITSLYAALSNATTAANTPTHTQQPQPHTHSTTINVKNTSAAGTANANGNAAAAVVDNNPSTRINRYLKQVQENNPILDIMHHELSNAKPAGSLVISIIDSGPGVSEEDQCKLFNEYVQISPGQLQKGQGTGLGLSISKSIVHLHGGNIGMTSEGKGKGSTFFVELPAYKKTYALGTSSSLLSASASERGLDGETNSGTNRGSVNRQDSHSSASLRSIRRINNNNNNNNNNTKNGEKSGRISMRSAANKGSEFSYRGGSGGGGGNGGGDESRIGSKRIGVPSVSKTNSGSNNKKIVPLSNSSDNLLSTAVSTTEPTVTGTTTAATAVSSPVPPLEHAVSGQVVPMTAVDRDDSLLIARMGGGQKMLNAGAGVGTGEERESVMKVDSVESTDSNDHQQGRKIVLPAAAASSQVGDDSAVLDNGNGKVQVPPLASTSNTLSGLRLASPPLIASPTTSDPGAVAIVPNDTTLNRGTSLTGGPSSILAIASTSTKVGSNGNEQGITTTTGKLGKSISNTNLLSSRKPSATSMVRDSSFFSPIQTVGRLHILLVDDSDMNRKMLNRLLTREGHLVSEANDGTEAVALMRQQPCALMLLQGEGGDGGEAGENATLESSGGAGGGGGGEEGKGGTGGGRGGVTTTGALSLRKLQGRSSHYLSEKDDDNDGSSDEDSVNTRHERASMGTSSTSSNPIPRLESSRQQHSSAFRSSAMNTKSSMETQPIDVIIMDYYMHEMNGPEAAWHIRELGFEGPIVGVTGLMDDDCDEFIRLGANVVLCKPVNVAAIWKALRSIDYF